MTKNNCIFYRCEYHLYSNLRQLGTTGTGHVLLKFYYYHNKIDHNKLVKMFTSKKFLIFLTCIIKMYFGEFGFDD